MSIREIQAEVLKSRLDGGENLFLLDVRDADELVDFGRLANAVNIPLTQLRDRLGELPRDRRIVTYCQKGQRGYLAACLLHGRGFENVANLRGGFLQAALWDHTILR